MFGPKKASNDSLLRAYHSYLDGFDVVFVQEIRDASGEAWINLCELFEGYICMISSREGRTSSKEQIGLLYKDRSDLELLGFVTLSDEFDVWERSPVRADFLFGNVLVVVFSAHLKPGDVASELGALSVVADSISGPVLVIGDLNADCAYYNRFKYDYFEEWFWLVDEDTSVSVNTNCAYDRVIVNDELRVLVSGSGVIRSGVSKDLSDHFPVFVEVSV